MLSSLFGFLQTFTQVFQWLLTSFANILANLNVYVTQVYQVISLMPPFLKSSVLAIMCIMFIYTLMRFI